MQTYLDTLPFEALIAIAAQNSKTWPVECGEANFIKQTLIDYYGSLAK